MLRNSMRAFVYRIVPSTASAISLAAAAGLGVYLAHQDLAWHLARPQYAALTVLLALSGGSALALMLAYDSLDGERRRLAEENGALGRGRDDFIARSLRFEKRIESLAIIREIHRTSNINDRDERLRRLLWVLGDLSSAEDVTLFYHLDDGRTGPAAYFKMTERSEMFICYDRPRAGEDVPAGALACEGVTATHRNGRVNLVANLLAGGVPAGKVELAVEMPRGAERSQQDVTGLMESYLARPRIDAETVAEALEHKRMMRLRDAATGTLELAVPLVAEVQLVGALKVRLRSDRIANVRLADVEEVLLEAGKHIAMAMKKEEDSVRAVTDALTGLLIKRAFTARLGEEFARAQDGGGPFSLIMIDIDHFKKVNDKHGHPSGDAILRGVARVIRENLRACDVAFRYGGEELAAILPGASKAQAKRSAERLRKAVESSEFLGDRGQAIPIAVSLGVSEFEAKLSDPGEMLDHSDQALYRAKKGGRNCVRVWPLRTRKKKSGRSKKPSGTSSRARKSA